MKISSKLDLVKCVSGMPPHEEGRSQHLGVGIEVRQVRPLPKMLASLMVWVTHVGDLNEVLDSSSLA